MKEQILSLVEEILPQIDFTASDRLVDDGLLDSLSIVTLISELSMEFNVTFHINELTPENLNSIDAIVETVKKLQNQ